MSRDQEEALARLLDELAEPAGRPATSEPGHLGTAGRAATSEDEELRELVSLAASVSARPPAAPREEFRAELRERLVVEAATRTATAVPAAVSPVAWLRERFERLRRSLYLAIASVVTAGALGGAGVAVAAESAQPDELLYPVKRWTETVRLTLAGDDERVGSLQLAFAERRLAEVAEGVHRIQVDRQIALLAEMDDHTVHGGNELLDAYDRTGDIEHLRTLAGFIGGQHAGLRDVRDRAAVAVIPAIDASLRVLVTVEEDATSQALRGCLPCRDGDPSDGDRCCPTDGGVPAAGTSDDDPLLTPASVPPVIPGGTGSGIIPSVPSTDQATDQLPHLSTPSPPGGGPSLVPTDPTLPVETPSLPSAPDVPPPGPTESLPDAGDATEGVGDAVDDATGGLIGDEPLGD